MAVTHTRRNVYILCALARMTTNVRLRVTRKPRSQTRHAPESRVCEKKKDSAFCIELRVRIVRAVNGAGACVRNVRVSVRDRRTQRT